MYLYISSFYTSFHIQPAPSRFDQKHVLFLQANFYHARSPICNTICQKYIIFCIVVTEKYIIGCGICSDKLFGSIYFIVNVGICSSINAF